MFSHELSDSWVLGNPFFFSFFVKVSVDWPFNWDVINEYSSHFWDFIFQNEHHTGLKLGG